MKVIAINGSPHKNGNTAVALNIMADVLKKHGIETEILQAGKDIRGCTGCGACGKTGKADRPPSSSILFFRYRHPYRWQARLPHKPTHDARKHRSRERIGQKLVLKYLPEEIHLYPIGWINKISDFYSENFVIYRSLSLSLRCHSMNFVSDHRIFVKSSSNPD